MNNKSDLMKLIKSNYNTGIRQPSCGIGEIKEVMVEMRDGVKLRTVVYFPDTEGPWPTLFTRTPYPMEAIESANAEEYAKREYVYIFQFCRGTVGSEGNWVPNDNDRNDGIDSVKWLSEQTWCKSIGIHGISYMSFTAWMIADSLPEKVKTLYLCHYGVDRYLSAYKDGLFRHDILTGWAMGNAGKPVKTDYVQSSLYRPHINVDCDLWGIELKWYKQWITKTDYDDKYWHRGVWETLRKMPEKVKIPVCIMAGWYDHHLEGTILGYEKLNEIVKDKSKIVIGGWNHDFVPCVPAHDHKNAALNIQAHMFTWFDNILVKEQPAESGVETYIIGEDRWRKWNKWPIENNSLKNVFLTTEKRNDYNGYTAASHQQLQETEISYDYDPNDPVYSRGGETIFVSQDQRGSRLQEQPGYKKDVISFVSEPLNEDIKIAGKINAKLFVASDCEDTCFTAKVMEVLSDGDAYNIRSSITTLAFRNASYSRITYKPGEIVEINIEMLPITWTIKKGFSIRIDISSSNFPEYAVHSNYPGVWSLQDKTKIAHQTIYFGGRYSSRIEIPVI